jgi:hypothetical protein
MGSEILRDDVFGLRTNLGFQPDAGDKYTVEIAPERGGSARERTQTRTPGAF